MKKLSELSEDTMLTVEHRNDGEMEIMSVKDYYDSCYYLDYPVEPLTKVTIAEKTCAKFNLCEVLERIGEGETHESWYEDVLHDIDKSDLDVKGFEEKINTILSRNPTYWDGEEILIDVDVEKEVVENESTN